MQSQLPSCEAPTEPDFHHLVKAMLEDEPVRPEILARMLDPARLAQRMADDQALREQDWPNLGRYEDSNAAVLASGTRPDVIFMGDSLTEFWAIADPALFGSGRLCRGISGQTAPQMLVRFQSDVIKLQPRAVHLLAGTNDIAGTTGPTTPYRYLCAIESMVTLAKSQGVTVLLGLIPPARQMPWTRDLLRAPWIAELNAGLRDLAKSSAIILVDYFSALADLNGELPDSLSHDGVHPNRRGFECMRTALEPVLTQIEPP